MSDLHRLLRFVRTPTARLAAIHLAIIMVLSISFSAVFYHTSDRQFARPLPSFGQAPPSRLDSDRFGVELRSAITERFNQTREALLIRLIWLNVGALVAGSIISYLLARWSLTPIEKAMEAQAQFVSDASHELRTPLTILQTTNEVALRKPKLPAADARQLITHNIDEVKKLRDLSNTLLDLLKDRDDMPLGAVALQDVVSEAQSSVVAAAQAKRITIKDTTPPLTVWAHHALLVRLVAILLDNAVKYSPSDTTVTVLATTTGKKAQLHITDHGIGIAASDLPHIFDRFYRADTSRSSQSAQGYGLGLSIADKIATQLGAKILVESTLGKGSTFTIELPVQR